MALKQSGGMTRFEEFLEEVSEEKAVSEIFRHDPVKISVSFCLDAPIATVKRISEDFKKFNFLFVPIKSYISTTITYIYKEK